MNTYLEWFWYLLLATAIVWYCTVTVYVAVLGALDIRGMLTRLREGNGG
jgi:hypothetical protein